MGLSHSFEDMVRRMQTPCGHAQQMLPFDRLVETQSLATKVLGQAMIELRFETDADMKIGKPKKLARAEDKIRDDYDGDASLICDLARGKMIVDTPEQVQGIQKLLSDPHNNSMGRLGIFVVQESDYFKKPKHPTGYSCLNYKIAVPIGEDENGDKEYHIAELQIVAEQIERVAKSSHAFKREAEDLIAEGKMGPAERHMAAAYFGVARGITAKVRHESGYDILLENPARQGFNRKKETKFNNWLETLKKLAHQHDVVDSYAKDKALRSEEGDMTYAIKRSRGNTEFFRFEEADDLEDSNLERLSTISNSWVPAGKLGNLAHSKDFTVFDSKLKFDMDRVLYLTGLDKDQHTRSGRLEKALEGLSND